MGISGSCLFGLHFFFLYDCLRSAALDARKLDMHYIPSRYPNGLPGGTPHQFYSRSMAKDAVDSAKRIYDTLEAYYSDQGENEILEE